MFTGSIDKLADPQDVKILIEALPESNKPIYLHNEPDYEHLGKKYKVKERLKGRFCLGNGCA